MGGLERHAGQTVTRQTVTRQTMTRQTMTRRTITGRHVLTRWRAIPALMAVTSLVIVGAAHASQATPVKDTVKNTDQLSAISTGPHAKVTVRVKGAARIVTKVVPMPAGSLVSSSGPALATMIFGGTSACDLQAIGSANGQAASRTPPGALLQLTRGQILCTVVSVAEQIHLCGNGVIFVDGESQSAIQFNATCDRDPRFSVAVLQGSLGVQDPGGATSGVSAGQKLSCDPRHCIAQFEPASFSTRQLALLKAESKALHYTPPKTTTSLATTTTAVTTTNTT